MEDNKLYNSRIISTFIEYLHNAKPDINIEDLLRESGITTYEIEDEGHWLTNAKLMISIMR